MNKTMLILLMATASVIYADILSSENFESYALGTSISSLNGGTGWTGGWMVSQGSATVQTANTDDSTYVTGNNSGLMITPTSESGFRMYRPMQYTADRLYLSLRFTMPNIGTSDTQNPLIGVALYNYLHPNEFTYQSRIQFYEYSIGGAGLQVVSPDTSFNSSVKYPVSSYMTYHVIMEVDSSVGRSGARLYVDQDPNTVDDTWDSYDTLRTDPYDYAGVSVYYQNIDTSSLFLDEFIIATDPEDVGLNFSESLGAANISSVIPEPSSVLLMGIFGGLGWMVRKHFPNA